MFPQLPLSFKCQMGRYIQETRGQCSFLYWPCHRRSPATQNTEHGPRACPCCWLILAADIRHGAWGVSYNHTEGGGSREQGRCVVRSQQELLLVNNTNNISLSGYTYRDHNIMKASTRRRCDVRGGGGGFQVALGFGVSIHRRRRRQNAGPAFG